jgi:hypothetical protein
MAPIHDILPAEEDFLERMRLDGPPRGTWTISRRDGHWIIGWADEDGELIATGRGLNLRGSMGSICIDLRAGLKSPSDTHSRQWRRPGAL